MAAEETQAGSRSPMKNRGISWPKEPKEDNSTNTKKWHRRMALTAYGLHPRSRSN